MNTEQQVIDKLTYPDDVSFEYTFQLTNIIYDTGKTKRRKPLPTSCVVVCEDEDFDSLTETDAYWRDRIQDNHARDNDWLLESFDYTLISRVITCPNH